MAPRGLAALAGSVNNAKRLGQSVMSKAGLLFAGLQVLDWWEYYTDIEEDIEKMAKMEKRLIARMAIAKETLENAKLSPWLAHSKSVQQLEASMKATQKFLDYVASCGPLLRGASKKKFLAKFARFGGFITDALVAVQTDMTMSFTTHIGNVGAMQPPQVAPQGHDPGGGGALDQRLALADPNGNALMGQHPQPLLMPPPTPPRLPLPQQAVPPEHAHGTPTILLTPAAQTTPQVTGESAAPNGVVGWAPSPDVAFPVMHRRAASTGALTDFGRAEWSDDSGDFPSMVMHQTPGALGREIGADESGRPNNPDVVSPVTQRTPALAEGAGFDGAGWSSHPGGFSPMMVHQLRGPIDPYGGGRTSISEFGPPMLMDNASLAAVDAPTGYDGARLSNNPQAILPMIYDPCVAGGKPIFSESWLNSIDPFSRTPLQLSPEQARNGFERVARTNFGNPSPFQSRSDTAAIGSEGTISPMPQESTSQTTQNIPGAGVEGSTRSHVSGSISHATKQLRRALGIDGSNLPNRSYPVPQSPRQIPGALRKESSDWLNLSDPRSHAPEQITGVLRPNICYDSTGCPYYFDADTGQCYPAT